MNPGLRICSLLAVRNEVDYLQRLLPRLAADGVEVAVIDNGSTDGSLDVVRQYQGGPVIALEQQPYRGHFALTEQLAAKRELAGRLDHDWIVHHDADEVLEGTDPGSTLRSIIEQADAAGYNAINFEEFVFLPEPDIDYRGQDYVRRLLRYYYFAPCEQRLHRAWKRLSGIDNRSTGGHRLSGEGLLFAPWNGILRHYIVLGVAHACSKYLNRSFDEQEIQRGWHGNRLQLTRESLALPIWHPAISTLRRWDARDFCRDKPQALHYWEWSTSG
jgi:glycosyltransferase involved in cell wall biosynthesis